MEREEDESRDEDDEGESADSVASYFLGGSNVPVSATQAHVPAAKDGRNLEEPSNSRLGASPAKSPVSHERTENHRSRAGEANQNMDALDVAPSTAPAKVSDRETDRDKEKPRDPEKEKEKDSGSFFTRFRNQPEKEKDRLREESSPKSVRTPPERRDVRALRSDAELKAEIARLTKLLDGLLSK